MSDDPKKKLKNQINILLNEALDAPIEIESNRRDPEASDKAPGSLGEERDRVRSNSVLIPRRLAKGNRDAGMISDSANSDSSIDDNDIESVRDSRVDSIPPPTSNVVTLKAGKDNFFPAYGQVTPSQVRRCLVEHPDLVGLIRFDSYRGEIVKARECPWRTNGDLWEDIDTEQLKCWLSDKFGIVYPNSSLDGVINVVGFDNQFNSLQHEIKSFVWDGKERLNDFAVDYFSADDTPIHREYCKRWLISAIARAMDPGCQADCVLILEGWQGANKSQALKALASPKHYSDSPIDLNSTFAPQQLIGVWHYELAELVLKKAFGSEKAKAFISRARDDYSPKHMRRKIHQPRTNVFSGSTNDPLHNDDASGDRRSWSVSISDGIRCKVDKIHKDRELIFAEAYMFYLKFLEEKAKGIIDHLNPFKWWLEENDEVIAREEQDRRFQADVWEEVISQWFSTNSEAITKRGYITVSEVLFSCLKIKPKDWRRDDEMRVARILVSRFRWRKGMRMRTDFGRVYPYYPPADSGESG